MKNHKFVGSFKTHLTSKALHQSPKIHTDTSHIHRHITHPQRHITHPQRHITHPQRHITHPHTQTHQTSTPTDFSVSHIEISSQNHWLLLLQRTLCGCSFMKTLMRFCHTDTHRKTNTRRHTQAENQPGSHGNRYPSRWCGSQVWPARLHCWERLKSCGRIQWSMHSGIGCRLICTK